MIDFTQPNWVLAWLKIAKRVVLYPLKSIDAIISVLKINRIVPEDDVRVIFYDRFSMHCGFTEPVRTKFMGMGGVAIYLVGENNHPALTDENIGLKVFYIDRNVELFFRFIKVPLIITPATAFNVDASHSNTKVGHIFHSPVSMHYIYEDNSFDGYDYFFAVGPHHSKEFELLSALRGWKNKTCYPSGYPKIDRLANNYSGIHKSTNMGSSNTKVAFAPSWGEKNILRSHGQTIIKDLLAKGFDVVLRPHKHSFDYDMDVINELRGTFMGKAFKVDEGAGFDEMYSCDVLISDWSGVAYEFAFATGRPVVSVDVSGGQKIQTVKNREIDLKPMEDVCRFEVGMVSRPEDVSDLVCRALGKGALKWTDNIEVTKEKYLYNFGKSAEVIASRITRLVSE